MKIAFSNDHAAVASRHLIDELRQAGHEVLDYGVKTEDSVDYPDVAAPALQDIVHGKVDRVVLVCGSGIGMSIVANRIPGIRCAMVIDPFAAEMSRRHNNSNCLSLRSREQSEIMNSKLLSIWMATEFENGRHEDRIQKIEAIRSNCGIGLLNHEGEETK